jgi:hypothetical protein
LQTKERNLFGRSGRCVNVKAELSSQELEAKDEVEREIQKKTAAPLSRSSTEKQKKTMHPSSSSPSPAAVGVPELASTARAAAFAEVSRLLQHPEHLRRLPQLLAEYEAKRKVKEESKHRFFDCQSKLIFFPSVRSFPSVAPRPFSSLSFHHHHHHHHHRLALLPRFHRHSGQRRSPLLGRRGPGRRSQGHDGAAGRGFFLRRQAPRVLQGEFFLFLFSGIFFARLCFARSTISSRPAAGLVHAVP